MPNFSQATIMGHMVRDVEVRQAGDHDVGSFAVAVTKKIKGQETVSYFECKAWNQQCAFVSQWFKKGDAILVTGELSQETWDDKETGAKRSKVVITVERATFAGGGRGQQGGGNKQQASGGSSYGGRNRSRQGQVDSDRRKADEVYEERNGGSSSAGGDEIPF